MVAGGLHHIVESSFYTVEGAKATALTSFFSFSSGNEGQVV